MSGGQQHQEIVHEIVKVVGVDPATTFDQAREALETLFHRYEGDEEAKQIINKTYTHLSKIYEAHSVGVNVAIATKVALEKVLGESAELEQQHAALIDAINDLDEDHPMVEDFMQTMREVRDEEFMESGAYISYCPGCDITQEAMIPVAHDTAGIFHEMLTGGYEIPEWRRQELADFITSFVRGIQDEEAHDAA